LVLPDQGSNPQSTTSKYANHYTTDAVHTELKIDNLKNITRPDQFEMLVNF
jgi:hypothetical protein